MDEAKDREEERFTRESMKRVVTVMQNLGVLKERARQEKNAALYGAAVMAEALLEDTIKSVGNIEEKLKRHFEEEGADKEVVEEMIEEELRVPWSVILMQTLIIEGALMRIDCYDEKTREERH